MTDPDIVEVMAQSAYEAEAPHTAYMVGLSWTAFCKVHPNRAESFRINARASLAALRAHGMEVVPVKATPQMCQAYYDLCRKEETLAVAASDIWPVMITAAPPTAGK